MRSAFVTVALLCCWIPASYATRYTPARLTEGEQSIEALLRLPAKLDKRSYVVKCSAVISKLGRTRRFFWVWERLLIDEHGVLKDAVLGNVLGAPDPIVQQIRRSVLRMKFMPGFYEGKPVPMVFEDPALRDPRLYEYFDY